MCVIIVADKGTSKTSELFYTYIRTGATTNDDGLGFAYRKEGENKIFLSKGYFKVEELISDLTKSDLKDADELIVHCRIRTSGKVNDVNCHPFVISDKMDEIIMLNGETDKPVLAHNGGFSDYTYNSSDFSDTYHFTRQVMSIPEVYALLKRDQATFEQLFKPIINYNKIAILDPQTGIKLIGYFTIDANGWQYSNSGCVPYTKSKNYTTAVSEEDVYENSEFEKGYSRFLGCDESSYANRSLFDFKQDRVYNPVKFLESHVPKDISFDILTDANKDEFCIKVVSDLYEETVYFKTGDVYYITKLFKSNSDAIWLSQKAGIPFGSSSNVIVLESIGVLKRCSKLFPKEEYARKWHDYLLLTEKFPELSKSKFKKLSKLYSTKYHTHFLDVRGAGLIDRNALAEYLKNNFKKAVLTVT